MRLLIWHVDGFVAEPTEHGRSPVADAEPQTVHVEDALVVFAAVEKKDEAEPETTAERATAAIVQVAKQLGARTVVLHSFAHLFVELSTPETARQILNATQAGLEREGYNVGQTAFGWFNRLDMQAKGHPLSRVARQI
jgi:threonyl-tRNA synthetase